MIRNVYNGLLVVGNAWDARDLRSIYDTGIQAVVDLAINETPARAARDLVYCHFPINDGGGIREGIWAIALQTACELVLDGRRTLVACSAGMSRTPSIAAASLASLTYRTLDECLLQIIESTPNEVSSMLWKDIKRVCAARSSATKHDA